MAANFDLAAMEAQIRAHITAVHEEALPRARTDEDRRLLRRQAELTNVSVAAAIFAMRCENEGEDVELAAAALGLVLGGVIRNFAGNASCGESAAMLTVFGAIGKSLADAGRGGGDNIERSVSLRSRPFGSA